MPERRWPVVEPPELPRQLPEVIVCDAPLLQPTGLAWDPLREGFLCTSALHPTVSAVGPTGGVYQLLQEPCLGSTGGIHVDAARNRVVLAYADPAGPTGVGVFDLRDGSTVAIVELDPLGAGQLHDLALDPFGNAYVTDVAGGAIYRVDGDHSASLLVRDDRLDGLDLGLMGVVWHPEGYLLTVRHDTGELFRVPLREPHEPAAVRLDGPLTGADGLALRGDGALVVVTNGLLGGGEDGVTVLHPEPGWVAARTVRRQPWPDPTPTAITLTPYGDYVLSGRPYQLSTVLPDAHFTVRRL